MIVALTVRRLKPGTYDDFRRAWEPPDWPPEFQRAYHIRNARDENEVISFGFFDGSMDDLRRRQEEIDPDGRLRAEREERIAAFVDSVGADGVYEVIEEVTPG